MYCSLVSSRFQSPFANVSYLVYLALRIPIGLATIEALDSKTLIWFCHVRTLSLSLSLLGLKTSRLKKGNIHLHLGASDFYKIVTILL